jgi:hypothetical protein
MGQPEADRGFLRPVLLEQLFDVLGVLQFVAQPRAPQCGHDGPPVLPRTCSCQ